MTKVLRADTPPPPHLCPHTACWTYVGKASLLLAFTVEPSSLTIITPFREPISEAAPAMTSLSSPLGQSGFPILLYFTRSSASPSGSRDALRKGEVCVLFRSADLHPPSWQRTALQTY
ncbi:hypothetical protein CHARACLAT_023237 [Characodon lateralis]|uniref:Uncharacterized protein n=1 Tax=Characodon lateralis TaxID=208331 RepID=A0ABU7D2D2_9TELE|nr:hypothetical protein [Characodon lateralis]